jgi:hypothetical protein
MTRKSQRAKKEIEPQHQILPYIQRSKAIQRLSSLWSRENGSKSSGKREQEPRDRCPPPRPVVFIHYPYSNPHPPQIGRV